MVKVVLGNLLWRDWQTLYNKKVFRNDAKRYFSKVDDFSSCIENFGKAQYTKGRRVIVEGVQLGDETLFPNNSFFKGKPSIYIKQNSFRSGYQAGRRDKLSVYKSIERAMQQRDEQFDDYLKNADLVMGRKKLYEFLNNLH